MTHRTMQGKEIDLEKLMRQHELMPAIGNMRVNARGDELGAGGTIIRKREDVVAAYYEDNPKSLINQSIPIAVLTEEKPAGEILDTAIVKSKKNQIED